MRLEESTKEELLFLVNNLKSADAAEINSILCTVAVERNNRMLDIAETMNAKAEHEFSKYLDTVRPYCDSKGLSFIPIVVMDKAKKHYAAYEAAKLERAKAYADMVAEDG